MEVTGIASLHMDIETEGVRLGIHLVCNSRVFELLQDIARTDPPSLGFDGDVCRGVVMGLEEVICIEVGGEIGSYELGILTTGLDQCRY